MNDSLPLEEEQGIGISEKTSALSKLVRAEVYGATTEFADCCNFVVLFYRSNSGIGSIK